MEYNDILLKGALNIASALIFTLIIYRAKYSNKQLSISMMMLNIFVFCIMSIITTENFGLQAGLGLFAILSIFRFRSKNFDQVDIAYFFGAVALATVNGIAPMNGMLIIINGVIIMTPLLLDWSGNTNRMQTMTLTFDNIPEMLFDEEKLKKHISVKYGFIARSVSVEDVDHVKETATIEVQFTRMKADDA